MIKGIGIDICDIAKLKKAAGSGLKFLQRVFSAREIAYCTGKKNSILHFAGRFAAKEAFIKAVSTNKGIAMNRIEIINDRHGRPCIVINRWIRAALNKKKAGKISLSISHTKIAAAAVCVIT